ncbi:MAG: class I SAM-dependent methyltransferase [Acidobacteriota bacterium]|nr:class I SAM-dependent methyltransferase [Acidobacteriota bacterium]
MKTGAGTTPPGAVNEEQAARWVQGMFAGIAPRYDFINHLLSLNIDRGWRRVLIQRLAPVLARPDAKVLDLCCGTGDVLLDLQGIAKSRVLGADFCHPMLVATQQKARRNGFDAPVFEADAMRLPLGESALDAVAISFGFRNLANYGVGLSELYRVLRPGGVLAILEFSHPPGVFMKAAYGFYSRVMLPVIGTVVSGSREAYEYLPDSIRKFPGAEELRDMMRKAGFVDVRFELLTGGIAALHVGARGPESVPDYG